MSEFSFPCPACSQNISTDIGHSGDSITCPLCQASIIVPETGAPVSLEPGVPPWTGHEGTNVQQTSGLAVASLVCSLSSLVTCIGWLPGIICGHLAKSRMRRDSSLKGRGLAAAGLAIGYSILLLEAGTVGVKLWQLSTAVKQGFNTAQQQFATNNFIVTQTQTTTASNNPSVKSATPAPVPDQPPEPASFGWTSDIASASFPNQPASGKLHGIDFTFRTALLKGGDLFIRGPKGMAVEVARLGDSAIGQSFTVQPADSDNSNPHIRMTWTDESGATSTSYIKGYGLKLQFDPAQGQTVSGKIYLCFPDDSKSYIAGTFKARLPKLK